MILQTKLLASNSDSLKTELERIKFKLSKIAGIKTRGTIMRNTARWYEHGERNSKYLVNNDGGKITNPKDILEEEERFLEEIYTSRNMDHNCPTFSEFFETENALSEEIAKTCEGVMSVHECELASKAIENNKTAGTNGLTPEFYRYFWNLLGSFMVSNFNYAFRQKAWFEMFWRFIRNQTYRVFFILAYFPCHTSLFQKLASGFFSRSDSNKIHALPIFNFLVVSMEISIAFKNTFNRTSVFFQQLV